MAIAIWNWLFVQGYWQPISGILLGLLPFIWISKRHGWNKQGIFLWESYLLMVGGLMIVLGFWYLHADILIFIGFIILLYSWTIYTCYQVANKMGWNKTLAVLVGFAMPFGAALIYDYLYKKRLKTTANNPHTTRIGSFDS